MKITRYIALTVVMAVTAAHAATSILWDINSGSAGVDATSPIDFINAGVTQDVTSGTVDVIEGSGSTMWNAANDLSLSWVSNTAGTYFWSSISDPIMADAIVSSSSGVPYDMQLAGLTNYLTANTPYKFYLWGHGDGTGQETVFVFNGETKATPTGISPVSSGATNFVVIFDFTTGSTVSNTLNFTWSGTGGGGNRHSAVNGFAIVEDDGSTPPSEIPAGTPGAPYTVISKMAVQLKWAESTGTEPITYNVKRALVGETNFVTIGSVASTNNYWDTTVETNVTYDYVVSASNAFGVSANSSPAVTGVGFPYDILGGPSSYGEGSTLDIDNLFDNDIDTFLDTVNDAWAGVDFGEEKQFVAIAYVLRPWVLSTARAPGALFEASNDDTNFFTTVTLATVPSGVNAWPAINIATVSDTNSYRYIRLNRSVAYPLYAFAELDFITADEVTANGTWFQWLDSYYDIPGTNFADYAEADNSDTDMDGLPAYAEYDLNGDPTDPNSPQGTSGLYAWPEGALENVVRWNPSAVATATGGGYVVYRSLADDTNYTAVATVTTNEYTDTDVTDGVAYYYKVSATNALYNFETGLSGSEFAVANQYDIIGVMNNAGASVTRWFYELFDENTGTFMDDNTTGGWAGLDYGAGNAQEITKVAYYLRNDGFGTGGSFDLVIGGVTSVVSTAQFRVYGNTFQGSNTGDTNDWNIIATITNTIPQHGQWNEIAVTDSTPYRYVRYYPSSGNNNYAMADIVFNDTPITEFSIISGMVAGSDLVITWESSEGASYSVRTNGNLTDAGGWAAEASGITGADGSTSHTSTVSEATLFYQVTTP